MWVTKLLISPVKKGFFAQKRPNLAQNWHFWSIWARSCRLIQCPVGGSVGGCGARAVSRKTPIYFMILVIFMIIDSVKRLISTLAGASHLQRAVYRHHKRCIEKRCKEGFQSRRFFISSIPAFSPTKSLDQINNRQSNRLRVDHSVIYNFFCNLCPL